MLIVSLCSLALVGMVCGAEKQEKKSQSKKQAQTAQHAAQPTHGAGGAASGKKTSTATHQVQNNRNAHAAATASNVQVIANVQANLQQQGYYHGEVDGLIGPLTRGAIADYQRDHGLYTTSTIDEPTLQSLGIA